MENVELTIAQRAILMQIIPQEGDFLTFKIIKDMKSQIGFSEEDLQKFEIKQVDKIMTWNREKEETKTVSLGEKGIEIIITALHKLNDEKKINDTNFDLYQQFVKEE